MGWQSIESDLDLLAAEVNPGSFYHLITLSGPDWRRIWNLISKIHGQFKGTKFPTTERHQAAWERFQQLQDAAREGQEQARTVRREKSNEHRKSILLHLRAARLSSFSSHSVDDMKQLGQRVSEAGRMLSERKHDMIGEHKQECFEAISEIRHEHDLWWSEHKAAASQRQRDWRANVERNIAKNRERLAKAVAALERAEEHASKLRGDIASAWSDSFVDRASGWLAETEARIDDIEASIREISGWIDEDETKLR